MNHNKNHAFCQDYNRKGGRVKLDNLYRVYLGKRQGQHIWIVDGQKVVGQLYPPFIMGGNDQRYRFNPDNDVWIDNRIGCEELKYTIAHELIERKLMQEQGMTYDRAHDFGLALEKKMRDRDLREARRRARALKLPDAIAAVYRSFHKTIRGLKVWIVDGPLVRKELDGDFCFAGHDKNYSFIPEGEIWLDSAMSCEQMYYALKHELDERRGQEALCLQLAEQERQAQLARKHEKRLAPVKFGARERGVKNHPGKTRKR